MKPIKTIAVVALIVMAICFAAFTNRSSASKSNNTIVRGDGFAVLELFTSEGCSSCPPADELVARIQQEAGSMPVYVLAYHVDYWNRLGWKDVFSQPEFSKRQYQYSNQFTGQVYTPQLIINGKSSFVGSDEHPIRSAIKSALESKAPAPLDLQATLQGGKINITYQTKGGTTACQLLLAVVQKQATSKVTNGENTGRTLHHVQIVRKLYSVNLTPNHEGKQLLTLPDGFNTANWEVIGFLQDQKSGVIEGAARANFNGAPSL